MADSEVLKAGSLMDLLNASVNYMFLLVLCNKALGSYLLFPHLLIQCSKVIPELAL